jgi:hypothetical protein
MENLQKKSLRNVATVLTLFLAAVATAQAQSVDDPSAPSTDCKYEFGEGAFVWCVSENGNIVRLTSPKEAEHIRVGNVAEGYVVCAPGTGDGPYSDVNVASSGWGAAVLVEPPSETGVIIERTTTDGRFTLRQEFTGNRRDRSITIRMTVTNNSEDVDSVRLLRTADLDIDNTAGGDVFDKSRNAAWARQVRAVTLAALNRRVDHQVRVSKNRTPRNCVPAPYDDLPAVGLDLAASVRYDLGKLATGESHVVRVRYQVY